MQTEGLNPHEVLRFASVIAVGVTLLLTSAASYFLERQHNRRPLFALTMLLIAWSTVALGSATSGVGRLFPPVLVAAPLFSGFTGPALFIYTRQLTTPERPASLGWLALGLFGTAYSVLSLVIPNGLDGAIQALVHHQPYWHPLLSPLMVVQSLQLVTFALLSTGLITWAYATRSRPDLRQTQFWLLVTCWTTVCIVVLTNVLPNFKILLTQVEPAVMTLPFAVVGCLSVRALGAELTSRHEEHVEIRAERMESLGRMARGMAHDLNNVLAAVVGHAELAALKLPADAPAAPHLHQVLEGSEQAAALMKRLMTYSGRVDRSHPAVDPRAPLEAAFQALAPLQGPGCRMDLALEDDLPRVRVDPMELATAVGNLLSNAIQALPDGRGRVTLRAFSVDKAVLPDDATGADLAGLAALRIEVEDTGAGMTAVQASRALEPFYSSRPDGKGLGLVGVLSTVKGAGGALWFRSEPRVGTRFVLWLPAGPAEELLPVAPPAALPREVLFVDDDPEITTVLRLLLESLGVRAHCCASGEAALRYLRSPQCPDLRLAVVDIRLGAMDGIELSHRLLHTHGFAGILLISGDEPGPRLAQFAGQAVEFRRKPLGRDSLRQALEALLSTASGAPLASDR